MLKNYLKTAWRSLLRNKGYTAINVTGLAIGIAACLLLFIIIHFESSFDNFHPDRENIYRVLSVNPSPKGKDLLSGVPFPTAEGLRQDFPEIKKVATIMSDGTDQVTITGNNGADNKFNEKGSFYADPQFFELFNFPFIAGDKKTALAEPNTVVFTRTEADKFFGDWHNALGKVIKLNNKTPMKVTGVLQDIPVNSDFPLKMVMSYITLRTPGGDYYGNRNDWVSVLSQHYCFVQLPASMSVAKVNRDLIAFTKKHKPAEYANQTMQLQPFNDMHFNTQTGVFSGKHFSRQLITSLSLIGAFLLIIACVNFINLATAQAVNRSKEVGVRKVLGSGRQQLIWQFISETLIITLAAVIIGIILAELALPYLNTLLDVQLSAAFLADPVVIAFLVILLISVTLLSGFYPAVVVSGFNPITALKNRVAAGSTKGISLRRALVVLQFCIAQALVIGTIVIVKQMDLFHNQSLGFDKDAVVNVPLPADSLSRAHIDYVRQQLQQQPGIKSVSFSFASPSDDNSWFSDFRFDNSPKKTDFGACLRWADYNYYSLYNMKFAAGRAPIKTDTIHEYVVNETLMHKLGITDPQKILGKHIKLWDDKNKDAAVVGVVKDFNVGSLKDGIPPVLMASWKQTYQTINIKIDMHNTQQALSNIAKIWNQNYPKYIYESKFVDKKIEEFYVAENQLSALYKIFAGIAILISCLGLYGLVSFMAVQRTKEVGIRKTLGASVGHIVYLFSKEFTLLIIIAFAISAAPAWYYMHQWLQDYSYRVKIDVWVFVAAIISSVVIAWLSVGYKAVGAALANPVRSLRSE